MQRPLRILFLGLLIGAAAGALAHDATPCDETGLSLSRQYEGLLDEAATLEAQMSELHSHVTGRKINELHLLQAELSVYIDSLLNKADAIEELEANLNHLMTRFAALLAPPPKATQVVTVLELMANPSLLKPVTVFPIGNVNSFIRQVSFGAELLREFMEAPAQLRPRFLRAIYVGLVGPVRQAGIKVLNDIHKDLVEVKIMGSGSRLYGCLRSGELSILRYSPLHIAAARGNLDRYRHLCD